MKSYDQMLLSLSVSDFITGLTFSSFGISNISGMELLDNRILVSTGLIMAFALSAVNLLFIRFDRLLAVRFPIKHRVWMTRNKMNMIILISWAMVIISKIVSMLVYNVQPQALETSFHHTVPWAILLSAIIFMMVYGYIIYIVIKRKQPTKGQNKNNRRQDRVVIGTCISIVLIYPACSFPITIQIFISKKSSSQTSILLVFNAVLDPLVYFFKNYFEEKVKKKTIHTR